MANDPKASPAEPWWIADRLHSAAIRLLRRLRRNDTETGLTAARLSALSVLVFGGPRTLGELAAAEQVSAPTMTRIVHGLEKEGLAERHPDPSDGRQVRVAATEAGTHRLEEGRRRRVTELAEAVAELPDDEREHLARAVEILARLSEPNP